MVRHSPDSADSDWPLLAALRGRLRRLIWLSGVSASVMAVLGGLLIAGWCDWWLRIEDVGLRVLVSLCLWSVAAATLWQYLWRPLRYPLTDVMLARQLDRRYPGLASRLTTAAEFRAHQADARQGSPELQQLVIRQAAEDLRQIDPQDILESRRLSPLIVSAVMTCVMTVVVLQAYPLEAATALRRLAWPWSRIPWPQTVVLQLLDEQGQPLPWDPRAAIPVVRGAELALRVENTRGDLPDNLRLQKRVISPEVSSELEEQPLQVTRTPTAAEAPHNTTSVTLLAQQDTLEFRVVGGDDQSMPWFRMVAVDPPRLAETSIQVIPPAYTRQPAVTLPTGATQIRGWLGSTVEIAAQADRRVHEVELRNGKAAPVPVPVHDDAQSWLATLTIAQPNSASFHFVLRDQQGFADPRPLVFELRGDVDALPEILLTEPAADVWVTPTATIPLSMQARDDLGLTLLRHSWELRRESPDGEAATNAPHHEVLQNFGDARPAQATQDVSWELTPLQLQPGDRVVFRVEALDAYDLGEPHVGKSAPRTLVVVSPAEKQQELTGRVADVVDELRSAQEQQLRLQAETAQLQTQLRDTGEFRLTDRDLLSRLQADQRRLAGQLTDTLRGLEPRVEQLRSEFPANQLHDPEAEPQLEQLGQQLRELAEAVFPQLDQELTQAEKRLETKTATDPSNNNPPASPKSALENLATAEKLQQAVREALAERQQQLAQWQSDRQLGNALRVIAEQQQQLNEQAAELGAQTLARALPELTPQQRADLAKAADQQRRLAQQVEQLRREFSDLSNRLQTDEPERAAKAQDLADQVDDLRIAQQLRKAADDLGANRLGEAGPIQQRAADSLQKLVEDWAADRPDDTEQLVKQTRDAEQQAEQLHEDIDQLHKRAEAAAQAGPQTPISESLPQDAQELRKRIARLERQLERLKLRRGTEAARALEQRLQAAQQALEAGDHETAAAELAAAAEESLRLQEELTAQREQAEEQLAQEELERIAGSLASIKVRQDRVIEETERLEAERQAKGKLSRGQLRSLQDLAGVETELQQLTLEAEAKVEQAVVAKAALESVARNLEQVAKRLDERSTDTITLMLERDASTRLGRILRAWEQSQKQDQSAEAESQNDAANEENESQNAGPPGENLSLKLQLSLLRELQADCLSRTEFFEAQRQPDGTFAEDLLPLLSDLADEQSSLIQLTEKLVELYRQSQPVQPMSDEAPAAEETNDPKSADAEVLP